MNGTEEIGCCGAYCKTCREFEKTCKGCKLGYLGRLSEFGPGQMQDEEMLPD